MPNVNYINHLNAVLNQFSKDDRLNPTHISMYMALFNYWNFLHFPETFHVNREEIMKLSKIGSKATYHRVIKALGYYNYIVYMPSKNPFKGSKVKLFNFGTTVKQDKVEYNSINGTTIKQALVSKNKHIKTLKNNINEGQTSIPNSEKEVIKFFKNNDATTHEAQKFYNHYMATGWKFPNHTKIENWKALAKKWILKSQDFKPHENSQQQSQNKDNLNTSDYLHTNRNKNYNQPL